MTTEPPDPGNRPRGGDGRFVASIETAERDAAAARLRADGRTLEQIAAELGFASRGHAHNAIRRALTAAPAAAAETLRARSLARLDLQYEIAHEILEREHVVVSHGRIVRDDDGQPLRDAGAELAALDRMARADAEVRKLMGLDAATKVASEAKVTHILEGVDLDKL